MKQIVPFLFFISLILTTFATEQETDLLIVGNDTIFLYKYPLEDLDLIYSPFGNTYQTAPVRHVGEVTEQFGEYLTVSSILKKSFAVHQIVMKESII